jgi:hypothetical protein
MFSPDLYVAFYISLVHVTLFTINEIVYMIFIEKTAKFFLYRSDRPS